MSLATLSIDLIAKLAKLQDGLDKATRMNERAAAEIQARWDRLGAAGAAFGSAVAGAFSATAIITFTRETVNALDALNDARDATGSTIEKLSGLENIARKNGGTLDEVTGILVKFNGVLKEADGKNSVSLALQAIGLDAEELRRVDPAEALLTTAKALSQYADDGDKARVVQELFGKSIREAAPLLNDLADAGELNATVTAEQAKQAEIFSKQIAELNTRLNDAGRSLVSTFLPGINKFSDDMKLATERGQAMNYVIAETLKYWASPAMYLYRKFIAGQPAPSAGGGRGFVNPPLVVPGDDRPSIGGLPSPATKAPARAGGVLTLTKPISVPQDLADVADRLAGTDVVKIARLNAEIARLRDLVTTTGGADYVSEALASAEAELSRMMPMGDAYGPEAPAGLVEYRNSISQAAKSLVDGSTPRQMQQLLDIQEELSAQFKTGSISAEEYAESMDYLKERMEALKGKAVDVGGTIEQTLGDSLSIALTGNFDDIGDAWAKMLVGMAQKAAAADLMSLLQGKGLGGNFGTMLTDFAKFFAIPGFATGGDHAGGWRVVGERGPELEFTGPSRIVNSARSRQMMSGGAPTYVIQVAAGVGRAEVYEAVQQGMRASMADTRKQLRDRGL